MKADQKVIAIIFLFPIIAGGLAVLLLPRFINKQPFLTRAEIVRFVSPQTNPADIAQEYHLWLKVEMPSSAFDRIFGNGADNPSADAPRPSGRGSPQATAKKDEMVGGRLVTENLIQDMLVIKGFSYGVFEQSEIQPVRPATASATAGTILPAGGAPLRINKYITMAKENIRPLYDEAPLANPQMIPQKQFQPQTDIYQAAEGDKTLLYIHLESGIKAQKTSDMLSLTLTYLKDNKAIQAQTLPLFSY